MRRGGGRGTVRRMSLPTIPADAPTLLVVDGHPDPNSLCAALAARYAAAAREAGAAVDELRVRDLRFDLVLHAGLHGGQPLEPDLAEAQRRIERCRHLCLVTPLWWGSVPALLKGFLDRTLERGWAYRYSPRGIPQALLKGRSARVLMTADSPGWYLRLLQGQPTRRQLVRSTLRYCGFRPVDFVRYGPVHGSDDGDRARWLEDAARRGGADARRRWAP